jgi:ATP-binding cassette subfamily B multidrug efflux pump
VIQNTVLLHRAILEHPLQRRWTAIARGLREDAPIPVLDAATSALDSGVEAAIQEHRADLVAGRTVIAIAHRLSAIARMDRPAVPEEGRIAGRGTHAGLLARGGAYARPWERRWGGFAAAPARGAGGDGARRDARPEPASP